LTMGGGQSDEHEHEGINTQREPQYFVADGTAGDGFLRQSVYRWAHSYSASRVTECWEVKREDCISFMREQGYTSILNSQRQVRKSVSPTRRRSPTLTSHIGIPDPYINTTVGISPDFTTEVRIALRQDKRKAKAAEEIRAEKAAEMARKQKTNDNLPPNHIGFYQREGISTVAPNADARLHIRKPHFAAHPPLSTGCTISIRTNARDVCCGLDIHPIHRRVRSKEAGASESARPVSARQGSGVKEDVASHQRPATAKDRLKVSPPSLSERGSLQKKVLKEILATHKQSVSRTRETCGMEATVDAAISANPNGSIANARRGACIPKVSRFGELYFERFPPSFKTEAEISLKNTIPQKLTVAKKLKKTRKRSSKRSSSAHVSVGARSSVSEAHAASDDEFNFDDVIKSMSAVHDPKRPSAPSAIPRPPTSRPQRGRIPFDGKAARQLPTAYLSAHGFN
jgi:hypothetical protein